MARAQQPAKPVIGYLSTQAIAARPHYLAAFRKGLAAMGFNSRELILELARQRADQIADARCRDRRKVNKLVF